MARNTTGCRCRVPVTEAAVPMFATNGELIEWCQARGIELDLDHKNQLSVSMDDAYRLRDEAAEQSERSAREEAERKAKEEAAIRDAQQRRQDTYTATYTKAMRKGYAPSAVREMAWEAVHAAEAKLPAAVLQQLGPVTMPDVLPPTGWMRDTSSDQMI